MNFLEFIRPDLRELKPFPSARRLGKTGRIWLNANENPWQPNIPNPDHYNRYPSPQDQELIDKLAKLYQCKPEQLLITCGSDQSIDLLIRLCCKSYQDAILTCPPTFEMYEVYARHQAAAVIRVPLNKADGFSLAIDEIINSWQPTVKIIFVVSPNNPTGNLVAAATVEKLCRIFAGKALIVVDEAYIEFSHQKSMSRHIEKYPNLVVLRTLSKAFGLAGLRLGVTIADPELINLLQIVLPIYALSLASMLIAKQALLPANIAQVETQIKKIRAEREKLARMLAKFNCVTHIWPSEANFLLVEFKDSPAIMAYLIEQGIVLRHMNHHQVLANCIRITIGLPEENEILIQAIEEFNEQQNSVYRS